MTELLNSHRQDVREITSLAQSVFYVTKYIAKAPARFGTCKRYWTSKNWPKAYNTDAAPAFPKGIPVKREKAPVKEILKEWIQRGRSIWTVAQRIYGWGELVNPETGECYERPEETEPWEAGDAWEA